MVADVGPKPMPRAPSTIDAGEGETYVKVAGRWRYVDRAVDEHGQVIDVFVSPRRNLAAAGRFLRRRRDRARRTRRGRDRCRSRARDGDRRVDPGCVSREPRGAGDATGSGQAVEAEQVAASELLSDRRGTGGARPSSRRGR
ncbi:MAG: DDE-type integrase/transposase/recombinase [Acidimicrobiales bacterium]